ncbi:MAG: hypothetical protein ACOC56_05795 [Atribacterota bacterium]
MSYQNITTDKKTGEVYYTAEGSVAIHFGLNGDKLKSGSNSGSVSCNSEELEYGYQYQNFMEIKYGLQNPVMSNTRSAGISVNLLPVWKSIEKLTENGLILLIRQLEG